MTRFGVMKHLRLLEAAGLVTSPKIGREKLHYLNPVPIRLIHDRWTGKYAEPWVGALADLKVQPGRTAIERPRHVFQVYIRTTPEELWQAITDPEFTAALFSIARASTRPGSQATPIALLDRRRAGRRGHGARSRPAARAGHDLVVPREPGIARRPAVARDLGDRADGRQTCRLTLVHDDFPERDAQLQERRARAGRWCSAASRACSRRATAARAMSR